MDDPTPPTPVTDSTLPPTPPEVLPTAAAGPAAPPKARSAPPAQKPSIGRIVIYRLTEDDKENLGGPNPNNGADVAPAVIVRVFDDGKCNLRVLVDGGHVPWATSRSEWDASSTPSQPDGTWAWPPRV